MRSSDNQLIGGKGWGALSGSTRKSSSTSPAATAAIATGAADGGEAREEVNSAALLRRVATYIEEDPGAADKLAKAVGTVLLICAAINKNIFVLKALYCYDTP